MKVIEIQNRWTGAVLYSGEHADVKEAVEAAVKAGANLAGAYLTGANLAGAKVGAGDDEAALVGLRPIVQIGPIGSRNDWLLVFWCGDAGVRISTGCQQQITEAYFLERLAEGARRGRAGEYPCPAPPRSAGVCQAPADRPSGRKAVSGRLQVVMALMALLGIYALVGMVDADEVVRDAAQVRACTPNNAGQCATARK